MAGDFVHDPGLLDALERLPTCAFTRVVWRVTWATRDPLAGGTGGGRWHPPGQAEILYTSLTEEGALAEIYHHLSKAPVFSSSHTRIAQIHVRAERVLEFASVGALLAFGVSEDAFRRGDYARTCEIGAAARFLDIDALIVPSARAAAQNLVLFLDRLTPDSLTPGDIRDINWPAYRESLKRRK